MATAVYLDQLRVLADKVIGEVVEAARAEVGDLYNRIGSRFVRDMPKETWRATGSIRPYLGSPSGWVPPVAPRYEIAGSDDFDRVVRGWRPGKELGFEANVPYAKRLAEGWSKQKAAGWIDVLIREEVAKFYGGGRA